MSEPLESNSQSGGGLARGSGWSRRIALYSLVVPLCSNGFSVASTRIAAT